MASKTVLRERLDYHRSLLQKLYAAQTALVDGGVKSYMIDDRQLTRLDLGMLARQIEAEEAKVDELTSLLNGGGSRKAFGVVPMDW